MNKDLNSTISFFNNLEKNKLKIKTDWSITLPSPFVIPLQNYLKEKKAIGSDKIGIQNFYPKLNGAFTGENSLTMFKGFKLDYILVGHSERRMIFKEDNKFIEDKLDYALKNSKSKIIFIFGETKEDKEKGDINNLIKKSINPLLKLTSKDLKRIVIAYEPIWSIGTGKIPTIKETEDVFLKIKKNLAKKFNQKDIKELRIIYGGSISTDNYKAFLDSDIIDGLLIGGASLEPSKFIQFISYER